jgi:Xaa-Pro dipeptidase
VIGEWARDKLTRYSLLTGNGDPVHLGLRLRRQASPPARAVARARPLPRRSARLARRVGGDITLFRDAAREIKSILDAEGVGTMPLGLDVVEPPMLFELQKLGIEVRDGQQTLLAARKSRTSTS